ncbi:MAG TPA: VOC family protein [Terracidiphilus sp.]|jgi:catechol 2,3-dioxygenase-like lactoylglutathione lyase family enzyme
MSSATPRFTPNFIQVTPFLIVEDLEKALAFFVGLLDFEVQLRASEYAYVQRESASFRIWEQSGENAPPPGTRRFAYYIDVHDVDRLYTELKPKLDLLPSGDVHGPADKSYGQRELILLAPDGNLLVFGHAIEKL